MECLQNYAAKDAAYGAAVSAAPRFVIIVACSEHSLLSSAFSSNDIVQFFVAK